MSNFITELSKQTKSKLVLLLLLLKLSICNCIIPTGNIKKNQKTLDSSSLISEVLHEK